MTITEENTRQSRFSTRLDTTTGTVLPSGVLDRKTLNYLHGTISKW